MPPQSCSALGLCPSLGCVFTGLSSTEQTARQYKAILCVLGGRDVRVSAETGVPGAYTALGKTAVCVLPLSECLLQFIQGRATHKRALQTRGERSHLQRCFAAEDSRDGSRRVHTSSTEEKDVMAVRLFIGNLPYDVTEAELRAHFAAVGPLVSLALPIDRDTGRPRGFAFVEFRERADAEEAIRRLNNQALKGRPLAVSEARARDDRTTTGPSHTAAPRSSISAETSAGDRRPFGPDAAPRRQRKPLKSAAKSERGPKRPMYKRATGPVRLGAEDDEGEAEERGAYDARRHDTAGDDDTA